MKSGPSAERSRADYSNVGLGFHVGTSTLAREKQTERASRIRRGESKRQRLKIKD
jgi:hypothetical protein